MSITSREPRAGKYWVIERRSSHRFLLWNLNLFLPELSGGPFACRESFHVFTFRTCFTTQPASCTTYCQQGRCRQSSLLLDYFQKNLNLQPETTKRELASPCIHPPLCFIQYRPHIGTIWPKRVTLFLGNKTCVRMTKVSCSNVNFLPPRLFDCPWGHYARNMPKIWGLSWFYL